MLKPHSLLSTSFTYIPIQRGMGEKGGGRVKKEKRKRK
jgi:hypothetical protein